MRARLAFAFLARLYESPSQVFASNCLQDDDDEDPEERDPTGRFARYGQRVGKGRFKCVFKAFDEKQGIDVAWSKVLQASAPHNRAFLPSKVPQSHSCWQAPAT